MIEEMQALEMNGTWELKTLAEGKRTVKTEKQVLTSKNNPKGSIQRYKSILVAKGFTQAYSELMVLTTLGPFQQLIN